VKEDRSTLSHLDAAGRARMVDVGDKGETERSAVARGALFVHAKTLQLMRDNELSKGDALTVAQVAGIQAAKRTGEWIPLAHPVTVDHVAVEFHLDEETSSIAIQASVRAHGRTGVEMEALTAVAAAALTLYDMLKAADRSVVIGEICLWEKRGGRSGDWRREP
jgi:cyclic pyranopterin phosphate synthase